MADNEFRSKPYRMKTPTEDLIVEDDHFDKETAHESWPDDSMTGGGGFFRRYWVLFVLLMFVFLGLYLFYISVGSKTKTVRLSQATILDSRIDGIEARLSRLEEKTSTLPQQETPGVTPEVLDRLSDRIDRLESSFKTWMEEITAKMESAQKAPVAKKPVARKPPAQKPVAKVKPKQPAPEQKQAAKTVAKTEKQTPVGNADVRYHIVQSGETLYRLSIKYGLPVERIRALNQLPNHVIKPGQRLRVSP